MLNIIKSENLKYRNTFTRRLVFLSPSLFILLALLMKLFMPAGYLRPWDNLLHQVYNWWTVLFIPLGTALFASLIQSQEKKAGNYRVLKTYHLSFGKIWLGKVIVLALHTFFATITLIIVTLITGFLTAKGYIPWYKLFAGGLLSWLASLALIPLELWIANFAGTFGAMAIGGVGLISGVVAAPENYWIYIPWSWPIRLMCPIIGVNPNGLPLMPDSPLLDPTVIPLGIIISLSTTVVISLLTALSVNRKEVH